MTPLLKVKSAQELLDYLRSLDRKSQLRLGLAIAGGVIFFLFIFWPAWIGRPQTQNRIQMLRNAISVAQTQIRQEPKLLEEKRELEAFVQAAHRGLLTENDTQGLTGILTEMSEKSHVSLLASQPQTETQAIPAPFDQRYAVMSFVLAVEGGYHALASFISEIENYPKTLRVNEFSTLPRDEKPGILVGEIRLSAFFKREGG